MSFKSIRPPVPNPPRSHFLPSARPVRSVSPGANENKSLETGVAVAIAPSTLILRAKSLDGAERSNRDGATSISNKRIVRVAPGRFRHRAAARQEPAAEMGVKIEFGAEPWEQAPGGSGQRRARIAAVVPSRSRDVDRDRPPVAERFGQRIQRRSETPAALDFTGLKSRASGEIKTRNRRAGRNAGSARIMNAGCWDTARLGG